MRFTVKVIFESLHKKWDCFCAQQGQHRVLERGGKVIRYLDGLKENDASIAAIWNPAVRNIRPTNLQLFSKYYSALSCGKRWYML